VRVRVILNLNASSQNEHREVATDIQFSRLEVEVAERQERSSHIEVCRAFMRT
jgi:hypothetical protein